MPAKERLWKTIRRALAVVLLLCCLVGYALCVLCFLLLRTDDSAPMHVILIVFGYGGLTLTSSLQFVALRLIAAGLRALQIGLLCALPLAIMVPLSMHCIAHRNFHQNPQASSGSYHHHWHD